jgi:hypothetical protein
MHYPILPTGRPYAPCMKQAKSLSMPSRNPIGLTRQALSSQARKRGWRLRAKSVARPKAESTRETLRHLKDVVQKRLRQLEGEMGAIGEELNALKLT